MTADFLREAATTLRTLAGAATPGPWRFTDSEAANDVWNGGMVVVSADGDPIANVEDEWYENDPDEPAPLNDAAYIAAMNPGVGLLLAKWLDEAAEAWRLGTDFSDDALNLAHAVLGRES